VLLHGQRRALLKRRKRRKHYPGSLSLSASLYWFLVRELSYCLTSSLQKPLKEITTAAGRIASGDLGVAINLNDRKDEVGGLTRAFGAMIRYFQDLAAVSGRVAGGDLVVTVKPVSDKDVLGNAFANMIENLRKINQEIRDGVNVLASSASEILSSTTEIAAGMAETATSVSETTATMEEVKQTAQVSAQKSRGVSDNSQKAALVAEQGNAAVSETLTGIIRSTIDGNRCRERSHVERADSSSR